MTDNTVMGLLRYLLPIIACLPLQAKALELFGVELGSVGRDAMREAIEQAGVELLREGDEARKFDLYDSSAAVPGSARLYLGFTPDGARVAFVEYEFVGRHVERLHAELTRKYGEASVKGGRYLTDKAYSWRRDGIDIRLAYDWSLYRTRLSYIEPDALARLRNAGTPIAAENDETETISFF